MNKEKRVFSGRRFLRFRGFRIVLGWVLIVPGIFLFLTPIPVGIFMLTAGFLLLHSVSPRCRQRALNLASRFPNVARKLRLESFLTRDVSEDETDSLKRRD
jgi:Flp pilus assembly protein TadB